MRSLWNRKIVVLSQLIIEACFCHVVSTSTHLRLCFTSPLEECSWARLWLGTNISRNRISREERTLLIVWWNELFIICLFRDWIKSGATQEILKDLIGLFFIGFLQCYVSGHRCAGFLPLEKVRVQHICDDLRLFCHVNLYLVVANLFLIWNIYCTLFLWNITTFSLHF